MIRPQDSGFSEGRSESLRVSTDTVFLSSVIADWPLSVAPIDVERNSYFRRLSTLPQSTICKSIPRSLCLPSSMPPVEYCSLCHRFIKNSSTTPSTRSTNAFLQFCRKYWILQATICYRFHLGIPRTSQYTPVYRDIEGHGVIAPGRTRS